MIAIDNELYKENLVVHNFSFYQQIVEKYWRFLTKQEFSQAVLSFTDNDFCLLKARKLHP
jgi:hypothetical protein